MSINTNLWVERYRPQSLDEIVLSYDDRKFFEALASKQEIPHLLFAGTAGVGKCLDGEEVIEVFVSDDLYKKILDSY